MRVNEIFYSIQGESTYAGLPCVFLRLAGCNLDCTWCDTRRARDKDAGAEMSVAEVLAGVISYDCRLVEITGGEPLLQPACGEVAKKLLDLGKVVLVETNGSVSLADLDERVIRIVDVKCPSSGHAGSFLMENLGFITPRDEVKFVMADEADYKFALRFVKEHLRGAGPKVLFSPVESALPPKKLASWMLRDNAAARLQLQTHKYIWGDEAGR